MTVGAAIRRRRVDARLALPAAVAWVVAMVLIGIPASSVGSVAITVVLACAGGGLVAALGGRRRAVGGGASVRSVSALAPTLFITALVAAAVALAAPARTPPPVDAALDGAPVDVRVQLEVTAMPGEASVPARLVAISDRAGVSYAVSVPVRLVAVEVPAREPLGTTLEATARLIALEPGDARVALLRPLGDWQPTRDPPPVLAFGDGLRERFLGLMQHFGGDGAVLLPGLAIGDTSAVPDDLDLAMKHSSLSHLTAVSGANCAIVVGLILALGAVLRWPRGVRIAAALAALAFFVVLVTPEPSVIRASVMATAVLIAVQAGRPAQGLPILALAVMSILIIDPWIARQYGFVLSVLATSALLVLAGPLAERMRTVMPEPVALWIAVPLAAQLVCQPVLILLQPEIPVLGVVANILAAPAAPIATIVGMVACLLAPVVPWLATAVAAVAWLPSSWIAGVARVTAELPGALLPWPEGALGAALLAAVTLGLLVALGVPWAPGSPRRRRQVRLVACSLVVVVMGATAGADAVRDRLRPGEWSIAQCDVGQGDA
ncbi:MAG TPA: ComEC/Rec2 family competence protein, partial [Microcella sp.]|nr:ComEC/Rec2 family competence protein [Microcella sp.]